MSEEKNELSPEAMAAFRMEMKAIKNKWGIKTKRDSFGIEGNDIISIDENKLSEEEYKIWNELKRLMRECFSLQLGDTEKLDNLLNDFKTLVTPGTEISKKDEGVIPLYAWINNLLSTPLSFKGVDISDENNFKDFSEEMKSVTEHMSA